MTTLITPPVAPKGTRAGHDISIEVALDAGVPLDSIKSTLHEVTIDRPTGHSAFVQLKNRAEIPNKDFIFKYDVAGRRVSTLFEGVQPAGRRVVEWNGTDARGRRVAAGTYVVRLQAEGRSLTRRVLFVP